MASGRLKVAAAVPGQETESSAGELLLIDNIVDTTTGTVPLRASFPNRDEALWPGQFVNIALTLTTQTNAVVVPSQAVQVGQQGEYVFVVNSESTAETRPVVVGARVGEEIVLEKGLQSGDEVVTTGQLRLIPGMKVEIQNREELAAANNSRLEEANDPSSEPSQARP